MKKVITLILVALMLLSMLTACEQQTAQTETTPAPAPTAAPTKAPEKGITRAEFVAQLVGFFGWPHPDDYNDIWEDYAIADGLIKYTFNDVKKEDKYGKEIESAYRAGILAPDASGNFEPNREITRQEAAVIFANAWKLAASKKASMYTDAAKISADALPVITTLAELEIPLGKTDYEFGPDEPLPASEFEKAFQALKDKVVAPVYALPYQDYIAPRRYIKLYCATPDAVIYFTKDGTEPTNTSKAYSVVNDGYIMEMLGSRGGPSTEPVPTERDVVYKAYSAKDDMVSSEIQTMTWHLFRPAEADTPFSSRQMLEKTATCPAVYQLWNDAESVRPLAYYIEGQTSGIVFDCLQTPTSAQNLKEYIDKNFATKPYVVVVGHEHGDHDAQVQNFLQSGVPVYVNQRAWGSIGTPGAFGAVIPDPKDQAKVLNVDEGDSFDLGGCKFDVYALPGHANGLLILNDKVNGLVFSTDIYGCTRAGSADNVGVSGIKADLLLSMAQQCHANYLKDGGKVTMLFTGHDESPLNENNLFLYEAALQQVIDNGDKGCMPTLRGGTDAVYSRTTMIGDMWKDNTDWISLKLAGKVGDNTEYLTKNDQFNYNGKDGYLKYSVLSNIVIKGGELVGTKLEWAPPITFKWAGKDMTVENALPNKFNPWVYDYTIKVAAGTSEITIQPITMSTKVTSIKLNGQEVAYASENKVSVIDGTIITIEITAPDKTTKSTYTFTVDVA